MRARRAVPACLVVVGFVLAGLAVTTSAALAQFPYLGTGNLAEPASWKLAPGEVPDNIGGDAWKYAATPATPPSITSSPTEYAAVTQNNSQIDELCGVTGMSLVDANATMPSGTGSMHRRGDADPYRLRRDPRPPRRLDRRARLGRRMEQPQRDAPVPLEGPAEPRRATCPAGGHGPHLRSHHARGLRNRPRGHRRRLRRPRRHARWSAGGQRADPLRRAGTGRLQPPRLRVRFAGRERRGELSPVHQPADHQPLPQRATGGARPQRT